MDNDVTPPTSPKILSSLQSLHRRGPSRKMETDMPPIFIFVWGIAIFVVIQFVFACLIFGVLTIPPHIHLLDWHCHPNCLCLFYLCSLYGLELPLCWSGRWFIGGHGGIQEVWFGKRPNLFAKSPEILSLNGTFGVMDSKNLSAVHNVNKGKVHGRKL